MGQSEAEQRIMDGSAWNDFCDELKELGQLVFRPEVPADPFNRALGFRHLLRLLRGGIDLSGEGRMSACGVATRGCVAYQTHWCRKNPLSSDTVSLDPGVSRQL